MPTTLARSNVPRLRPVALGAAIACVVAITVTAGCGKRARRPAWKTPGVELAWPAPPDRARVIYQGVLRSARDLGKPRSLSSRIFGEQTQEMVRPIAVARNLVGALVVADPGVPTVHYFYLERGEYRRLEGAEAAGLQSPVGIALDDTGRVYVADSARGRVLVFDERRKPLAEFGEGILERPTSVALDRTQERLYVGDAAADRVVIFDRAGRELGRFGRRGERPGELNGPTHVTVAEDGHVLVTDSLNFRIQEFSADGTFISSLGQQGTGAGSFARPKGVAIDSSGRRFVVDAAFENVQIFAPDGKLLLAFGGPGAGPGEFTLPTGVFVDAHDTLWVTDSYNKRVQAFHLATGAE